MTDRPLLDALADLLDRLDPPPHSLAALASAALAERAGAALTRLITDSAHTADTGMRGTCRVRTLRFADLDLRLEPTGTGLRATGLARTGTHAVTAWPGGSRTTPVDPTGWFHVDHVPPGPVRFVLRDEGRPDLSTRWFVA
ncbi:hypothetical protein ABZ816_12230 [Actinosynnema sp. NPDC047251]|uniref:Uncharacterized protein n=1 Tax=Saccharothrix espanaensis (strain ATCC 51144 / DSM 44229 / JCM 9112 / NBRC 15066 / NRRL 15764) TaxID=1179773 RepID=K0KCS9_SACES|nr:hypothetical protein [Saccharothrix espanaensis]CCH35367.1 hypothetical protein BN6_81500 [Saccharothrix espanaensis DSM 44229]